MYKLCLLFLLVGCNVGIVPTKPQNQFSSFWDRNVSRFSKPTVVPAHPFDPRKDAAVLRKAMGMGGHKRMMTCIQLLTRRTNEQRLHIKSEYGPDLVKDLLRGATQDSSFVYLIKALMTPLSQFYAIELHDAVAIKSFIGVYHNIFAIVEILCTLSNHEIRLIKQAYIARYGTYFAKDIRQDDRDEYFNNLMISLYQSNRSNDFHVDRQKARKNAVSLLHDGALGERKAKSTFINILSSQSFPQLDAVFQEYKILTGLDIDKAINLKSWGDLGYALRTIVKVVRNKPLYFAERLHKSMIGLGTVEPILNRIMVTRCEVDLGNIADMFQAQYHETLQSWIEDDTSRYYRRILIALLGL